MGSRKLDAICKETLSDRYVLAWLLKSCIEEFANYSIKDIATKYIEGNVTISERPVHRDEVPDKIIGLNTEDSSITEGKVTYDLMFTAIIPGTNDRIRMYINIEAQSDFNPGYPLIMRGIYYCCRMISAQYEREFTGSHYEDLKKVCSIWICTKPPKNRQNSITQYTIHEETVVGNATEEKKHYDLMKCIMICLGDENDTDGILRLLDSLLSQELDDVTKGTILKDEFDIDMTKTLEKGLKDMCNYSKGVEQTGIEKGIKIGEEKGIKIGEEKGIKIGEERGIQKGLTVTINTCKNVGVSFADTVRQVAEGFGFTQERSKLEVEKYW
jgi:hypothetical protein